MSNDRQTTVRLKEEIFDLLQIASGLLKKSQKFIIEEALQEYFKKHDLGERYELTMTKQYSVLSRVEEPRARIIDVQPINGISPEALAQQYCKKLRAPVAVILEEEEGSHD